MEGRVVSRVFWATSQQRKYQPCKHPLLWGEVSCRIRLRGGASPSSSWDSDGAESGWSVRLSAPPGLSRPGLSVNRHNPPQRECFQPSLTTHHPSTGRVGLCQLPLPVMSTCLPHGSHFSRSRTEGNGWREGKRQRMRGEGLVC